MINRRALSKSVLFSPFASLYERSNIGHIKIGNDLVKIPDKWELRKINYHENIPVVNIDGDFSTLLNQDINGIPVCRTIQYSPNNKRFSDIYIVPCTLCLDETSFFHAMKRTTSQVDYYEHGLIVYMKDLNLYGFVVSACYEFSKPFKLVENN